ncbi:MAG: adenine phosphoribosyltransferase [Candidatus Omnitrophota bacterium]
MDMQAVRKLIRDIPDFPKPGIIFKDITPVLQDAAVFRYVMDAMADQLKGTEIDCVVGIESRGFIFSPVLAYRMKIGFIPVRKKGKLPYKTREIRYALEYGEGILEIHDDAIAKGMKVAIVDDLLATGGTALATAQLVEKLGGQVKKIGFLVELEFLAGRKKLKDYDVFSLIRY